MQSTQMKARAAAGLLLAAAATGCASTPPIPPLEPVTSIAGKVCDTAVSRAAPVNLSPPPKETPEQHFVSHTFDQTTACIGGEAGERNYQVFELSGFTSGKLLTAGAPLDAKRVLAVKVSLLDRDGNVTRSFPREDYLFRGDTYSVQFRPRDTEAFVLIETDPALVGQERQSVATGMNGQYMSTGTGGGYTAYYGYDQKRAHVFSHEGKATIRIQTIKAIAN